MSRSDALADLTAATSSTEMLGQSVDIEGIDDPVVVVMRNLTQEEAATFGNDGLLVEGIRLTVDVGLLGFEPVPNSQMVVNSKRYGVSQVQKIGVRRRITLTRFLS